MVKRSWVYNNYVTAFVEQDAWYRKFSKSEWPLKALDTDRLIYLLWVTIAVYDRNFFVRDLIHSMDLCKLFTPHINLFLNSVKKLTALLVRSIQFQAHCIRLFKLAFIVMYAYMRAEYEYINGHLATRLVWRRHSLVWLCLCMIRSVISIYMHVHTQVNIVSCTWVGGSHMSNNSPLHLSGSRIPTSRCSQV